MQQAVLFGFYVVIWTSWTLLIKGSVGDLGYYSYDPLTVVFMIEILKLLLSLALFFTQGQTPSRTYIKEAIMWWPSGLFFALPAFIYVFYNMMTFYNLSHFDPISYRVLINIRIPMAALLCQKILLKRLSTKKWIAIAILLLGCFTNQWKPSNPPNLIHISFIIHVIIQAFAGSLADVYSEYLLKRDTNTSIHVKNAFLYVFTCGFTLVFILATKSDILAGSEIFFRGYNVVTWVIIVIGAMCGLSTSFVLQQLNVILKDYAKAVEMVVVVFASVVLFGQPFGTNILLSVLLISFSLYLYYDSSDIIRKVTQKPLDEVI